MARYAFIAVIAFFSLALASPLKAEERHSLAQVRMMVFDAATFLERDGPERAFPAFNHPFGKWVRGDLYIFAFDMNGVYQASGFQPERTGINAWEMTDPKGFKVVQEFIKLAKAEKEGVVEYLWTNPVNGKVEKKISFVKRVGDYIIGAGFYVPGEQRPGN